MPVLGTPLGRLLLGAALLSGVSASAGPDAGPGAQPQGFGISAEAGDIRFSFGEHAAATGVEGDAAYIVCEDLAERLSLCFTRVQGDVRRHLTKADLESAGVTKAELRSWARDGAKARVGSERPKSVSIEGGGKYWTSAEGDGWDVAGLLAPELLVKHLGEGVVVALPQRNSLLAWKSGDTELDTIMAVGVARMYEAAEAPVSPLVYRWDGERWQVWGEAKKP